MTSWSEVAPYFDTDAVAHLATLLEDGAPHVTPLWVGPHEASDLAFFTTEGSRKDRNLARDPRVAVSVTAPGNAYAMATVRGEVVERVDGERALAIIDRISTLYTGAPYDQRDGHVAFIVRPHTWTAHDYAAG